MNFEWDEKKNEENFGKHGIDFADVKEIFDGPMLVDLDTRFDYGEDRLIGIGFIKDEVIVIVFTEHPDDTIRVISARKALKHERIEFEEFLKDELGTDC
jgi:hypothetical protein